MSSSSAEPLRLFVYDTLLSRERDHGMLGGAPFVGPASTPSAFHLIDLGAFGAAVAGGTTAIAGEVYLVEVKTLLALDIVREVPRLFRRALVSLADGAEAYAYVMDPDQVRGRRRIHRGSWRERFVENVRPIDGPFARWARNRFADR